jgi:hypothetical protein
MLNGQGVGRAQAKMVTDTWCSIQPVEYLDQLSDYHILSIYCTLLHTSSDLPVNTMFLVLNHTLVATVTSDVTSGFPRL